MIQKVSRQFRYKSVLSFISRISELYEKARAGEISGFTGIDSAYEPPEGAELVSTLVRN